MVQLLCACVCVCLGGVDTEALRFVSIILKNGSVIVCVGGGCWYWSFIKIRINNLKNGSVIVCGGGDIEALLRFVSII